MMSRSKSDGGAEVTVPPRGTNVRLRRSASKSVGGRVGGALGLMPGVGPARGRSCATPRAASFPMTWPLGVSHVTSGNRPPRTSCRT